MSIANVLTFDDPDAAQLGYAGGKGSNLAKLTQAGFAVPPGFCVTTEAYRRFLEVDDGAGWLAEAVQGLDYDPERLERQTEAIRQMLTATVLPAELAREIEQAYAKLGDDVYVAVRSSGTAEDLADASFAGLHDTYLDVRGIDEVLAAVKACWASMWTGRATAYRHNNGFDHGSAALCVVVQVMVASEVSGVMFTANPLTAATDESVINSSWGLGEAVVQGITTPDTYLVRHRDLTVKERRLGAKEVRIIRDPDAASGTITEDVPEGDRKRWTLTDDQAADLAAVGLRIQEHYGELPQDVEWALADGTLYVLQSRPVTGVEFFWEADLDMCAKPHDDDTTWTRQFADDVVTGVTTPLMYTVRFADSYNNTMYSYMGDLFGVPEISAMRPYRYHKGEIYYNADLERIWIEKLTWKDFRPGMLGWLPEAWHQDVIDAPFSIKTYLQMLARIRLLEPKLAWNGWGRILEDWRANRTEESSGLTYEQIRRLSDKEVVNYCERMIDIEEQWGKVVFPGMFIYMREVLNVLGLMVTKWYDGPNTSAFIELLSGSTGLTDTTKQNAQQAALAEEIRNNPELYETFQRNENEAFFAALEHTTPGEAFLERYRSFVTEVGHRGQSDRDMWYPRRCEDPSLDYQAFKSMLNGEPVDHEAREAEVNSRRDQTYTEVCDNIRAKPFGGLKVELFKLAFASVHKQLVARDNERNNPGDVISMSMKRGYMEIAKRMRERGLIEEELDIFFLGRNELYPIFLGNAPVTPLIRAKIAGRKRDCLRFHRKEVKLPLYLHRDRPVDLSAGAATDTDGVYRGVGTSRGSITGKARAIRTLAEIGKVETGEILVVNSTDPGWTPVFRVISAVVVETGGLLAHASCLAREYGFPAVQLSDAIDLIPDGALIEVDGTMGTVRLLDDATAP